MNPDTGHALQPNLLQSLFQRMTQQGQSFHLVSKDEKHRERFLADIKKAAPDNCKVALISFYKYRASYLNFVEKLAQDFGVAERKDLSLSIIKKQIQEEPDTKFLILMDDFEKVANRMDADTRYDGDFVGHLNNMREIPNVHLVIASEREGKHYWLKKDDDHKIILSWLFAGLEEMALPAYSNDEIRNELARHLSLSPQHIEQIVDKFAHPMATLDSTLQYLRNAATLEDNWEAQLQQHLQSNKPKSKGTVQRWLIDLQYTFEKWRLYHKPALFIGGFILLAIVFLCANQVWRDTIWNWCAQKLTDFLK